MRFSAKVGDMNPKTKRCKDGTLHLVKIPRRSTASVEKSALLALKEASELFGYKKPVEVAIFSSHPETVIPELGIVGRAIFEGDIVVDIDFTRKDIARIIKRELPSTLYHELSHVVRNATARYGETLLDALVSEGIGAYTENKIFRRTTPYTEPIRHEKKYLQNARRMFNKRQYNHPEWFWGQGKLPRWIGYRLGYLLVDSFMKQHKNLSFAQLVRIESRKVAQESQLL